MPARLAMGFSGGCWATTNTSGNSLNTFIWTNEIPERGKANINDSDKMSIPENVQQILNQ